MTLLDKQKTKRTGTTRKRNNQQVGSKIGTKFLNNLTQLISRRHFLMLNDFDMATQSEIKVNKKRYSSNSSMINNEYMMKEQEFIQNPEVDVLDDPNENQLTFSINQGLQALKNQLNIDLNDFIKDENLGEDNQEVLQNLFDMNNHDLSNLLRTPPTMGTQLHSFQHRHDLRNQLTLNGEISSQSSVGVAKTMEDKLFSQEFRGKTDIETNNTDMPKEISKDEINQ